MVNFLPAPPEFESSRFVADQTQYLWGKRQRQNEERAAMAIRDAVYGMQPLFRSSVLFWDWKSPRKTRPNYTHFYRM